MQLTDEVVPFTAGDGMRCNVVHVTGDRSPTRGPVLLVHGAGVRSSIFRAPVTTNLVDALIEDGFDVWLENWRASIDLRSNQWTLDQAAVFDHPRAVRTVLSHTGRSELQAVIHCQGSTSFMMAAVAGLLPEVRTIVSNAVSLHPIVPPLARLKITSLHRPMKLLTRYIDPHWGVEAPDAIASAIAAWVRLTHHECSNTVCRLVSFTYGVGAPALWSHANLDDRTHDWLKEEFGPVPITFFDQMAACLRAGHLVSVDGRDELPHSFVAQPPQTDARFVFLAGANNLCFLPESQRRTFEFFDGFRPGYHAFHRLPNYGHLDVFIGFHAATDVFPIITEELRKDAL